MGWDNAIPTMSTGDKWRRHRRIAQQVFRQSAISQYYPTQLKKVHRLLQGLLDTPERFDYHNKMCVHLRIFDQFGTYRLIRLSMSIPMSIMYGHDLESLDDPFIVTAEEMMTMGLKLIQPGYTLINILPFLRHIPSWIPGAISQRMVKEVHKMSDVLEFSPLETMRKQLVSTFQSVMIQKVCHGSKL